mmetsp:Transcript_22959/g.58419  ORF Transcript_22959/g.58419 Transcript_22959/m.58419 type:complete len:466 (+) Transcript_22959:90-1487(+)
MSGLSVLQNGDGDGDVPDWVIDALSTTESSSVADHARTSGQVDHTGTFGVVVGERQACWGAELKGTADGCAAGFHAGRNHFKNKFCARCRACMDVPAARVRALTKEQANQAFNQLASGFWKRAPASMEFCMVRIANQTRNCHGPVLCLFRDLPPPMSFAEVPTKWVSGLDIGHPVVRFSVKNGTLVPTIEASRRPLTFGLPKMGSKRQRRGELAREEPSLGTGSATVAASHRHSSSDDSEMADSLADFVAEIASWGDHPNSGCSSASSPVLSLAAAPPLAPWSDSLATSHATTIAQLEETLATETSLSGSIRAMLLRQLEDARRNLHEIRLLATQMAPEALAPAVSTATATEGLSVSAATVAEESSASPARGRRTSATWSNFAVVSELSEKGGLPCPTSWQRPEHYSITLNRFSRGQSDARLYTQRTRIQSLGLLLRRFLLGAPRDSSNGASVQGEVGEGDSNGG